MLSKPRNGWTNITPISLFVDEEGSECLINSYYDVTHIITDRDDIVTCLTFRDIDYMDITYMIICDIKEYFEDWVKWSPYEDEEKDYQNRRKELNELTAGV